MYEMVEFGLNCDDINVRESCILYLGALTKNRNALIKYQKLLKFVCLNVKQCHAKPTQENEAIVISSLHALCDTMQIQFVSLYMLPIFFSFFLFLF